MNREHEGSVGNWQGTTEMRCSCGWSRELLAEYEFGELATMFQDHVVASFDAKAHVDPSRRSSFAPPGDPAEHVPLPAGACSCGYVPDGPKTY